MLSPLAGVLRLASLAISLVVIASFAAFVVDQTSSASAHQQDVLNGTAPAPGASEGTNPATTSTTRESSKAPASRESSLHRTIDDASNAFTSPFSGVTAGSSSEWVIRGTKLLLALIVYGFGLGFLARVIRVKA